MAKLQALVSVGGAAGNREGAGPPGRLPASSTSPLGVCASGWLLLQLTESHPGSTDRLSITLAINCVWREGDVR